MGDTLEPMRSDLVPQAYFGKETVPSLLPEIDSRTHEVANDFFGGLAEMFETPKTIIEKVHFTQYDPVGPVSSRYADRVLEHLGAEVASYETVGLLMQNEKGELSLREMKSQGDVDMEQKLDPSSIIYKDVGNAVRLIISKDFKDELEKRGGIARLKEEVQALRQEMGLAKVPIEVLALKNDDWHEKVPIFFRQIQTLLPITARVRQQGATVPTSLVSKGQSTKSGRPLTSMSPQKSKQTKRKREEIEPGKFPEPPAKKIKKMEERFLKHDWEVEKESKELDAEVVRQEDKQVQSEENKPPDYRANYKT